MKVRTKIASMHETYGVKEGYTCGSCCNLESIQNSRTCYKCRAYGITGSAASDWRKKWVACSLYNKDMMTPPIFRNPPEEVIEDPMPGQIDMFSICESLES